MHSRDAAFRKGLSEAGYIESQNVAVEYHWLGGHYERAPALLADLVRRGVAVISTPGDNVSIVSKAATASIPIVFGVTSDPLELGLVASLARPGGNATGICFVGDGLNAKRLGLMHDLLPRATRFAVLLNPTNATSMAAASKELEQAAPALGVRTLLFNASTPVQIDAAFGAISRERIGGLFIAGNAFFSASRSQIAALAAVRRIAASGHRREMVEAGLLMSYGASIPEMYRQVGVYTGIVLTGANPAELPVQQSGKFELVINLKTAKTLGLEIPPTLLARADEVIE
jgi:putative ABC transport system substrate-binding protein